jgi:hypothetical protein
MGDYSFILYFPRARIWWAMGKFPANFPRISRIFPAIFPQFSRKFPANFPQICRIFAGFSLQIFSAAESNLHHAPSADTRHETGDGGQKHRRGVRLWDCATSLRRGLWLCGVSCCPVALRMHPVASVVRPLRPMALRCIL